MDNLQIFFFEWLAKVRARAKKYIELREEYVEQIPSLVTVASSFLVRLRTYQHPLLYKMSKKIPEVRKCNGAMKDLSSIERQKNFLYTDYED